jgi:hypothetical protein
MQLLLNHHTNQVKRTGSREDIMKRGQPRRTHLRRSKSKQGTQRARKGHTALRDAITNENETSSFELTHSLLLSSLRYWEVERDLIEERVAAIGR